VSYVKVGGIANERK